jgi:diacylglycerol kinase family enzyme
MRYSAINASVGFLAKIVHRAERYKSTMGQGAYGFSGIQLIYEGEIADDVSSSI